MAARTAADGVGASEWLEMDGEKKPLEISELGCADGCGREMVRRTPWTAADGVGAREWLEMGGKKKPLVMSELGCEDGCGWQKVRRTARTAADGVGAREWLEMGGEKKPLEISELAYYTDGCGREMGGENCADGCGRRRCQGVAGNRYREKKPLEISELGCADGCGREMGGENRADGCGRRGCKGVAGNGWGDEAAGNQRAWLRGWLRTGDGCGELRGRLRTAWVQRSAWKGRKRRW